MLSVSLMQAESMIGLLSNYITRIVPLLQRREVVHNNITPLSKLFWQRTDDGLGTSVIVNDPQPRLSAFFLTNHVSTATLGHSLCGNPFLFIPSFFLSSSSPLSEGRVNRLRLRCPFVSIISTASVLTVRAPLY